MTSQAAKYAALASVELKGLDDVQWYVGALSTWCAAAISYIESGSENGARAELGTFIVRRYAQARCLCLSVFPMMALELKRWGSFLSLDIHLM